MEVLEFIGHFHKTHRTHCYLTRVYFELAEKVKLHPGTYIVSLILRQFLMHLSIQLSTIEARVRQLSQYILGILQLQLPHLDEMLFNLKNLKLDKMITKRERLMNMNSVL